jgi:hypothetical protein
VYDLTLEHARILRNLKLSKSCTQLQHAFSAASHEAFEKQGLFFYLRKLSTRELYHALVNFHTLSLTDAVKQEMMLWRFKWQSSYANLRSIPLSYRIKNKVWEAWHKALPKIYGEGDNSVCCPRCILGDNESDSHHQHEHSIHLFVHCFDTVQLANLISQELYRRCGKHFSWGPSYEIRYFTLATNSSSSILYMTLSAIFIYITWLHRCEAMFDYDAWLSDSTNKTKSINMFFTELQRSANLAWYKLKVRRQFLSCRQYEKATNKFHSTWKIGTLFKIENNLVYYI